LALPKYGSGIAPDAYKRLSLTMYLANTKALLVMPFADGVQSSVNKAKNIHFVGEKPCESKKDISNAEFLPNVASSRMKAYLKCLQPRD
jgi:hypothetical protein